MQLQPQRTHQGDSGFTLVELLVVIIIIGILAAIAVPAFLNQRQRANDAATKSDVKSLALIYEEWGVGHPGMTYPDVFDHWGVTTSNTDPTTFIYKLSPGTEIHAFDMASYFPAENYKAGEAYCIQAKNQHGKGVFVFYHSAQGGILKAGWDCPDAPGAP